MTCWVLKPWTEHRQTCGQNKVRYILVYRFYLHFIRAPDNSVMTWQNQQNDLCAQQRLRSSGHPQSLIRVFAVRIKKYWVLGYQLSAQQRLIRWGGCPGWSESLLGTHVILLVLLCLGSFIFLNDDLTDLWSRIYELSHKKNFSVVRFVILQTGKYYKFEPPHNITNKMTCTQRRLIRPVWSESSLCGQRRLWSD